MDSFKKTVTCVSKTMKNKRYVLNNELLTFKE